MRVFWRGNLVFASFTMHKCFEPRRLEFPIVPVYPRPVPRGISMNRFPSFIKLSVAALVLAAAIVSPAHADSHEVVIGYQDMVVPWRYAQATGEVEKATGYKV